MRRARIFMGGEALNAPDAWLDRRKPERVLARIYLVPLRWRQWAGVDARCKLWLERRRCRA